MKVPVTLFAAAVGLSLVGCATSTDIDKKIAESQTKTDKKIESVETQVAQLQEGQKTTAGKVEDQGKQIAQLGQSARRRSRAPRRLCSREGQDRLPAVVRRGPRPLASAPELTKE